jgi:hypothetical protein
MEQDEISHGRVCPGIGEHIPGRGDEKDVRPFFINVRFNPDADFFLYVIDEKIDHILESVRLNSQMVSGPVAVGYGGCNPVDVKTQEVEDFPCHDGDFSRIDAVGAKDRATPAFGALEKIVPPFLEYIQS